MFFVDDRDNATKNLATADENIKQAARRGVVLDASIGTARNQRRRCRDLGERRGGYIAAKLARAIGRRLARVRKAHERRVELLGREVARRITIGRHQWRGRGVNEDREFRVAHLERSRGAGNVNADRHRAWTGRQRLRVDCAIEQCERGSVRIEIKRVDRMPPIEGRRAVIHSAHGDHGHRIEHANLEHGIGRARQIVKANALEDNANAAALHTIIERRLERTLREVTNGAAEPVHRAIRVRPELHAEPIRALYLLELADRIATVEVDFVPVVALLADISNVIAASGHDDRLAARVARHAAGRLALLAHIGVDAGIAAG